MRLIRAIAPAARRWKAARPSRPACAAIATLAVAALATGCQNHSTSGNAAGQTAAISVAAIPGPNDAPLYVAAKNGLFRNAGLNVTIRSYRSVADELGALKAGRVDVAAGDYADFFYAEATSRKPDLRIIADGYHAAPGVMEVLASPGSGITMPKDLIGKTIGTPEPQLMPIKKGTPYSLETIATESVLQNDGVDLTKLTKVTWRPMPSADLLNALARKQVSAILVQEPYIFEAQSRLGAVEVLDSCSGATASLPLSGYFAVASFAEKNADALQDFRSALQRAQAQAVLPGPVHNVLASEPGMNRQSASLVTIGSYPTSLDAAGLQRVAGLMFNFGVLNTTLNVAPMVFG